MNQMQYYKEVYSKFWVNQTKNYGHEEYTQKLVALIAQSGPEKVFEVGIGTGWPVGAALKEKGIKVDGCDVADDSVALAQEELDNREGIWVGEVTEFQEGGIPYDVTYCVRLSWCIPDFYTVVKKMISMTKTGGYLVFDVMDKNSLYCLKNRLITMKEKYFKFLGIEMDERFGTNYISLFRMKRFLRKAGLTFECWGEREITNNQDKYHTPKVVFVCRKER